MAGTKLSNRQRMINMMYLVLLAMLALNVRVEVLDAFESLRIRLMDSSQLANENDQDFVQSMKAAIDEEVERHKKMTNAGLKDTLDQIRGKTQATIASINAHILKLEEMGEFDEEEGTYKRKDEMEKNFQYWMGTNEEAANGRGNGEAFDLRNELDEYATYIADIYNSQVKGDSLKITPELTQNPVKKKDDPKNLSWERNTLEGPLISNLATLEALKIDVYRQEKKLLDLLNQRLGVFKIVADKVIAVNSPVATIVPAGLPFQTRLAVALSSSTIQPKYYSPAGNIVGENSGTTALLSIPANGALIPDGKSEAIQRYTATIEVPTAFGEAERLTVTDEFIVRRPEVVVSSATVQNLYRKCGNAINIDVPALGDYYTPVVTASNATIKQSTASPKRFLIMPNGNQSVVNVSSRTNGQTIHIGKVKYRVITPPKPRLELKINGQPYQGIRTVSPNSRMTIRVIPDREFLASLPDDARYRIKTLEVRLKDRIGPPRLIGTVDISGSDATRAIPVRLTSEVRQARRGSTLIIQVKGISRKNFKNELIPVPGISAYESSMAVILE